MTTRASHKARGASFETGLVQWFRNHRYLAERLRLAGAKDEGDIVIQTKVYDPWADDILTDGYTVVECKAPGAGNAIDLSGWLREAHLEAKHYAEARKIPLMYVRPLLVIKARGKSLDEAYVVQRLCDVFPNQEETNE